MRYVKYAVGIVVVALGVLAYNAVFVVDETQQALVLQFGEFKRAVHEPGLHVKLPFMQNVVRYEDRLLRYDSAPSEYLTEDKKALVVDAYARYEITDPLAFYRTLRNRPQAHARLDAIIASSLREAVASHEQSEIITEKREPIIAEVTKHTEERTNEFGVKIVDVRIKRTDFPQEIAQSIYDRMRAERHRISSRYRSEGEEEALKIRAEADKQREIVLAEARRRAEEIRGEADGEAIRIYAEALRQDPEFYAFTKSLEVYQESMNNSSRVILSANSPLFRYLEGPTDGTSP